MGKNNVHSRLTMRLKKYVELYKTEENILTTYRENVRNGAKEEEVLSREELAMHKNNLNYLTKEIIQCKKDIKNSQKKWQVDQVLANWYNPNNKVKLQVKGIRPISKQHFISFMKLIQDAMYKDEMMNKKLLDVIHEYKPELKDFISMTPLDNSELYSKLLNWVARAIGDNTVNSQYGSWVDYFVYETDWGTKYDDKEDVVKDNGKPVPFKTLSDVYNAVRRFSSKPLLSSSGPVIPSC